MFPTFSRGAINAVTAKVTVMSKIYLINLSCNSCCIAKETTNGILYMSGLTTPFLDLYFNLCAHSLYVSGRIPISGRIIIFLVE